MSTLKENIEEIGNLALALQDPSSEGWTLPLQGTDLEAAVNIAEEEFFQQVELLMKLSLEVLSDERNNTRKGDVSLAARLYDHDCIGIVDGVYSDLEWLKMIIERDFGQKKFEIATNRLFTNFHEVKQFLITIAFLATNDNTYAIPVKTSNLAYFHIPERNMFFEDNINGTIYSPETVAVHQLANNARYRVGRNDSIIIGFEGDEDYNILTVQNQGRGVSNRDGTPMSKEDLPKIFGEFSTKKIGGLGLQVVKRIVELRKGYLELFTRSNNSVLEYNSVRNTAIESTHQMDKGTKFVLYIPK